MNRAISIPFISGLLLCCTVFTSAAEPQFVAVDGWLKPAPDMETIGQAHGDVAVASNGDVYVSVGGPRGGVQVFGPDGRYLRNVPNAPADIHGFVIF